MTRLLISAVIASLPLAFPLSSAGAAPSRQTRHLPCGFRISYKDDPVYRNLACSRGIALRVVDHGMRLQPARGHPFWLNFDDDTILATDSGAGVLRGLRAGDHVCAAYTARRSRPVARIVAFDPSSNPCAPGKHLQPIEDGASRLPAR